jgi:hypothetical protein
MTMMEKIEAVTRASKQTKSLAEFCHPEGLQHHPNPCLDWKRSPQEE